MIKAVIFDMDDTLYPEYEYTLSGFLAVDQYLEKKGILGFGKVAIHLFEEGNRGKIFNQALDILNIKYNKTDITQLINIYRRHIPKIKLFPDAKEILDILKGKVPLGLISDGYLEAQQMKVQALELCTQMDKIILTDEFGRNAWKPSSIPYQLISDYFKISPNELIYIGDNITKDFVMANKLGWTTVQIIRESNEYKDINMGPNYHAQIKIKSLLEILDIINLKV